MKIPPQNVEFEESILASCLLGDAYDVVGLLSHEDFYNPTHSKIFAVIQGMVDRSLPVDLITVSSEIGGTGISSSTLSEITQNAPIATNIEYCAEGIRKKAALRRLIEKCEASASAAYLPGADADEVINSAQAGIISIQYQKASADSCGIRDLCMTVTDEIAERKNNPRSVNGIPSGFTNLDKTLHGFQDSDFIILAARPSMGKTALMLDMVRFAVLHGIPSAVFSLEMSRRQLLYRLASQMSGVGMNSLLTGDISKADDAAVNSAMERIFPAPLYIDDKPSLSAVELRRKLRKMKHEHGVRIAFVDYLQLMKSDSKPTRDREVAEISAGIKTAAKELEMPVVALSQLNRSVESRDNHRPRLSDLRDSGTLEQDADVIMFLYRAEPYIAEKYDQNGNETPDFTQLKNHAEVQIAKHRNGATGVTSLFWNPGITSFGNIETHRNGG